VKLYLEDFSKLQFKLNTLDPAKLSLSTVNNHVETFARLYKNNNFTDDAGNADLQDCQIFLEWGLKFGEYALHVLGMNEYEASINDANSKIAVKEFEGKIALEVLTIYESREITQFFNDVKTNKELDEEFDDSLCQQRNYARFSQDRHNNFRTKFIKDLNKMRSLNPEKEDNEGKTKVRKSLF